MVIEDFNLTDDVTTLGHCLHRLLERAAVKYLDKTALICSDTELSYGELHALANRFARVLVERGTRRGDVIGVALDRSIDLVVVLLAVLKAGAAYVPIDPAIPAERINHILTDAAPKLVVASTSTTGALVSWEGVCLNLDQARSQMSPTSDSSNLTIDVHPEDLAYILYTSGTTGKPKGVDISHEALCNMLLSVQREPGCGEMDRLLALSNVSFDMAVPELFLPLLCGATTAIAQTTQVRDAGELLRLMERHAITIIQGTPTILQMLVDGGWRGEPRLNKVLSAGEPLPRRLAERLLDCSDQVWNLYGPTETTVHATAWSVVRGEDIIVGGPLANVRLYVLDADLSPVPPGSSGEVYIGGSSLARGYHNKPDLTQSRFLKNPFHEGLMYRTGDLARFLAPGKLSLLGRADDQVKIRGHRIELGDIEAAMTDHEDVSRAIAASRDGRLVAYYVRETRDVALSGDGTKVSLDRVLRRWLTERLPAYMVPAFIVELDAFPVTVNRKVDRKALPDPVAAIQNATSTEPTPDLEGQILAIWSSVLGHDRISVNDNFFEIGGDSVRVVRVQRKLKELLGCSVSPAKLFEHYTIKQLSAYLAGGHNASREGIAARPRTNDDEGIAIVSMACRLPGGVATPEDFWDVLKSESDVITDVPRNRWDANALYDADPNASGKSYSRRGGFIQSIDSFDAQFFGISPREARALDPMQHLMLETCWEGFERAGYTSEKLRGSRTGVFIGVSNVSAYHCCTRGLPDLDGYSVTGTGCGTMSGRVSYVLGLEGPALTIDTACSSSLVATHLACNALRQGECDMAVSGGVNLMLTPALHVEFSRLRGMSPDGRCRAFAADAEGAGWGEGSAAVVLKRLSDAQRDGDVIHAVLRGSAVNHGGRGASLTTPSGPAQQRLIRAALAVSDLQPGDIDYIEAHGTGTKLGDPIEGGALAEVFAGSRPETGEPLWIGTAKSNIGHTQAAAGLVGILKVVLAMNHSMLPQTLHVAEPTPAVDWQGANMAPMQKKRPWLPRDSRLRRAGVSSFGISGTNAHAVVEEPPRQTAEAEAESSKQSAPLPCGVPFLLSGHSDAALRQQAARLRLHLSRGGMTGRLGDVAYSLATTRNHFRQRLALIANDKEELLNKLANVPISSITGPGTHTKEPRLAMLFTGQGSQLLGMGRKLAQHYPVFREALDEIADHFKKALHSPLLDVMWADADSEAAALLQRTDYAQPALFVLEVALWRLWDSWGVRPEFVLGHSIGELAAAHVAGVMDLSDACRLVLARGQLMQALPVRGGMVSFEAGAAEVAAAIDTLGLGSNIDIAGYNTPTQTVVSGDVCGIEKLTAYFVSRGRKSKTLDVSRAFHSHHVDGMLAAIEAVAETVRFHPPRLAVISSVTGKLVEAGELVTPAYWAQQARSAVRFNGGIQTLADHGANVFLELGPRPVLCGMGAACLTDYCRDVRQIAWLPSLVPDKDDAAVVQGSLAELHVRHVPISWASYFEPFGCRRVELPTYAFQRECFRFVPEMSSDAHCTSDTARALFSSVTEQRVDNFEFGINWQPVEIGDSDFSALWGLYCPAGEVSWAEDVKTALLSAGVRLLSVSHLKDAEHLAGLLCLWDSDADVLRQTRHFTEKALNQIQDAARTAFAPPIVWVTRHAVGTSVGDGAVGLGAGPLWGLMRTARNEHPELRLHMIDLDDGEATFNALASCLALGAEPEYAVRQGQVLVPRMQRVEPEADGGFLPRSGAVLVTGGLGGIGKRVARWLAGAHGVRDLVLTSRQGMAAPGAKAFVEELSQLGAQATVVAGNIADADSVKDIIALFNGDRPLRGVIHTAGVLDDGVLSALTPARCDTVFEPKVDGAWYLHQLTQDMDLNLFVMFSSVSGVMGTAGQGNYAAANTFLDALAYLRRAEHRPAASVAWGTWSGGGMADNLSETCRARYAQLGLDPLTPEDGLELLERAIRGGRGLTIAAAYNLGRLRKCYGDRDRIPSLLCSLLGHGSGQAQGGGGDGDLRKALSRAGPEEATAIAISMVRETVAKTLGFSSPDDVNVDVPPQELGIDSLTAVLVRNRLAALTYLSLPATIVLDQPNLTVLSQCLLSQIQESSVDSSSGVASGSATPLTVTSSASVLDMAAIEKGYLEPGVTFENVTQGICASRPKSVFVTGATGFVGAFILHELLEQGIAALCLVRASCVDHAMQRLVTVLTGHGLWKPEYAPLLNPVVGDMGRRLLGLDEQTFDQLANQVDAICHSGSLVDWMRPLEDYLGPNIVSTHEVLRLASRGRGKTIHVISTFATLPKYLGREIAETSREYGYATSKWTAERMVAAARWRGAKASVYRLPFVTASATTGHFRQHCGDFLHNLIAGGLELGDFPSLDANLSFVLPVDYLSKIISTVVTNGPPRVGCDFDFVNAHAPSFDKFFQLMGAASGGQGIVTFRSWRLRALAHATADPTSPLARIAVVLDGLDEQSIAAMLRGSPVGEHVLGDDSSSTPLVDEQFVRRYLDRINAARAERSSTNVVAKRIEHSFVTTINLSTSRHSQPNGNEQVPRIHGKLSISPSPISRVLSPALGLCPDNTPPHLFSSALSYFASFPWCSRLIHDWSPTSGLLPGYGQAITFISRCFNPVSSRHDQFVGNTLSHGHHSNTTANGINGLSTNGLGKTPPLRHMLSLFRPSDAEQSRDPSRPILRVSTLFALGHGTSGYEAIMHGGFIATLFDESLGVVNELNTALGKAGSVFAGISVTASLNIQFAAPVATAETVVCVTAWIERIHGNKTMIKAELTNSEGDKLATAESAWVAVNS